jgi:hypothetical protein
MIIDGLPAQVRPKYRDLVFAVSHLEMRDRLLARSKVDANVPKQPKVFHVLHRGDFRSPREVVKPAGIAALDGLPADFGLPPDAPEAERRAKLAKWVTDLRNPLPKWFIVNPGTISSRPGGYPTTSVSITAPSHPELLDWMARVDPQWLEPEELHGFSSPQRLIARPHFVAAEESPRQLPAREIRMNPSRLPLRTSLQVRKTRIIACSGGKVRNVSKPRPFAMPSWQSAAN